MVERKCGARGEFVEDGCLDASGMAPQRKFKKQEGPAGALNG